MDQLKREINQQKRELDCLQKRINDQLPPKQKQPGKTSVTKVEY